ncbi:helix-turn-helix domain-containing protein [Kribbella turkmenica]|uniref:Helix-turn-helix domain-containing protein n=1 Tax=Kribbella turkmenica TaxID=2530375 RepID=A0A4R4XEL8_9ACTN|nr:BTAD domain-containing putative transcriptional regulator [Kribbella turkmenica]TDD29193.1 helix-turn-helix domain-containing protein [Kribbella turkmenica]
MKHKSAEGGSTRQPAPTASEARIPPIRYRVLGQLELAHGRPGAGLTGGRQRSLLAALLAANGQVVSKDTLVEIVWGGRRLEDPYASLYTQMSRLRMLLPEGVLETKWSGYSLTVPPEQVDSQCFLTLLTEARRFRAAEPERAVALLEEGLSLWRGRAYEEFLHDEYIASAARQLQEMEMTAREEWFDLQLELKRHDDVVVALTSYVSEHPFRERGVEQLMRALAAQGNQAEALQVYANHRLTLSTELGIEPSAGLQSLHLSLLSPEADAQAEPLPTPPDISTAPVGPKMPWNTELIGRSAEIESLRKLIHGNRLVTVAGPGGVGKTRLALETANRMRSELQVDVHLCELAGVRESADVPAAVASAMGANIRESGDSHRAIAKQLSTTSAILVLDNCEHVRSSVELFVGAVLENCPNVRLVATSRLRLGADGERVLTLGPLALPDGDSLRSARSSPAVRLFLDRVSAFREFDLSLENVADVVDICSRIDGMPLGLELAASRMRMMSAAELSQQLSRTVTTLDGGGDRKSGGRHHLREIVEWSYQLLDDVQRQAFERLSIFAGGFSIAAAEAVCEGIAEKGLTSDVVQELVDHSLIYIREQDSDITSFGMFETLKAYAAERLADRSDMEACRDQHAGYLTRLAREIEAVEEERAAFERLWRLFRMHRADVLAAVRWCIETDREPDRAFTMLAAMWYAVHIDHARDVVDLGQQALTRWPAKIHPLYPMVCGTVANGRLVIGDLDAAVDYADHAIAADGGRRSVRSLHARRVMAHIAHTVEGDHVAAMRWIDDVVEIASAHGLLCDLSNLRAMVVAAQGDLLQAIQLAELGSRRAMARGSRMETLWSRFLLGAFNIPLSANRAKLFLEATLDDALRLHQSHVVAVSARALAVLDSQEGRPAEAAGSLERALDLFVATGNPMQEWYTIAAVLPLLTAVGDDTTAATLAGAVAGGSPRWKPNPAFTPLYRQAEQELEARMDRDLLEAHQARGALLSQDELLAMARELLRSLAVTGD